MEFLKMRRPCIDPNIGFIHQLVMAEYLLQEQVEQEWEVIQKRRKQEEKEREKLATEKENEIEYEFDLPTDSEDSKLTEDSTENSDDSSVIERSVDEVIVDSESSDLPDLF